MSATHGLPSNGGGAMQDETHETVNVIVDGDEYGFVYLLKGACGLHSILRRNKDGVFEIEPSPERWEPVTPKDFVHLLRNPWGHSEQNIRAARLWAADKLEHLAGIGAENVQDHSNPDAGEATVADNPAGSSASPATEATPRVDAIIAQHIVSIGDWSERHIKRDMALTDLHEAELAAAKSPLPQDKNIESYGDDGPVTRIEPWRAWLRSLQDDPENPIGPTIEGKWAGEALAYIERMEAPVQDPSRCTCPAWVDGHAHEPDCAMATENGGSTVEGEKQ